MKQYKYLDIATVVFVVALLLSNLVSSNKFAEIGSFAFGSGVILFPISYLIGDVLTEVYGYSRSRRVIWIGFCSLVISVGIVQLILWMPPAHDWPNQKAYEIVFANVPRTVVSSLIAYFIGEFTNSYVMAKMKIWTKGKYLWTRTIGSTILGEGVDTLIFYPCAFLGVFAGSLILKIMIANYILKVLWEIIATPLTYQIINFLKKKENEDHYDYETDFNPFVIS